MFTCGLLFMLFLLFLLYFCFFVSVFYFAVNLSVCSLAIHVCTWISILSLAREREKLFTSQKMLNNLCMSIHEIIIDYHIFLCWPQVVRAKERLDEELRMQENENVQQKQTTGESETQHLLQRCRNESLKRPCQYEVYGFSQILYINFCEVHNFLPEVTSYMYIYTCRLLVVL